MVDGAVGSCEGCSDYWLLSEVLRCWIRKYSRDGGGRTVERSS